MAELISIPLADSIDWNPEDSEALLSEIFDAFRKNIEYIRAQPKVELKPSIYDCLRAT